MSGALGSLRFRPPRAEDGRRMAELVRASGELDVNSTYCYAMLGQWFSETCLIAETKEEGRLAGMVTGFRLPSDPLTLFVWQIAVDSRYRGQGVAMALLNELTAELDVRFVETTISPSNGPSRRLFQKWADSLRMAITVSEGFREGIFLEPGHEAEELYRMGPIVRDLESD
ncbi:diaminobutyrate acetyltransferase [Cohnella zeiphila]|uniref:L-2,4-diaminobutyric acid acetyltransferase n=1 Tax=Cohnella zeiphila TaxID=2761120 RepID=A0A7X0VV43_9BACL|nr:diaminobutyrate acetyltransferase [Cohnella zeiphila]MBB6731739.1 diaminobutyrate acetyltransferase [Cohnella zeiphila]